MGRKSKYETHVLPHLNEIPKWYEDMTEGEIAHKLGISVASFENYKDKYPELLAALQSGRKKLADELKSSLRERAKGIYYTEKKRTYSTDETGKSIISDIKVEETTKYAPPDVGAIHLLLKNIDDEWRNDDATTLKLKQERLEMEKQKQEDNW